MTYDGMAKPITARIAMEIASHEALVRQTYLDSRNVPTWSVGLTKATGHDVSRYKGKPASLERCLEVYAWALDNYAEDVRRRFAGVELTEAQMGGALSFHWNLGRIMTASWPKLWMAGKVERAKTSYLSYKHPPEVVERRKADAALFFEGTWSAGREIPEITRLTARGTPAWSSRVMIDVADQMAALFREDDRPTPMLTAAELVAMLRGRGDLPADVLASLARVPVTA